MHEPRTIAAIEDWLRVVEAIARSAGDHATRLLSAGLTSSPKGAGDVVTNADALVEDHIVAALQERFPFSQFLGEERGSSVDLEDRARFVWVVDPIDGTTNYYRGLPDWCVSIALVFEGEPVLGVVHAPKLAWSCGAARGVGAKMNGRRLPVRGRSPEPHIVGLGFDPMTTWDAQAEVIHAVSRAGLAYRRLGSGAISLAYVAQGSLDAFVQPIAQPWDTLAGKVLVTESGGSLIHGRAANELERGPIIALGKEPAERVLHFAYTARDLIREAHVTAARNW